MQTVPNVRCRSEHYMKSFRLLLNQAVKKDLILFFAKMSCEHLRTVVSIYTGGHKKHISDLGLPVSPVVLNSEKIYSEPVPLNSLKKLETSIV
jgi:hypothetical protein